MHKQRRSWTNGSASTFAGQKLMKTVTVNASPAAKRTTLPNSKLVISCPVGTEFIGGSLTMSDRNALPAIFTDKENSTFLHKLSTVKDQDELRSLCEQRTRQESIRLVNYETALNITGRSPYVSHRRRMLCLSDEDRDTYNKLREERYVLMAETVDCGTNGQREWRWRRWKRINAELYTMTGHRGYLYT
jgi:hypothetical protein